MSDLKNRTEELLLDLRRKYHGTATSSRALTQLGLVLEHLQTQERWLQRIEELLVCWEAIPGGGMPSVGEVFDEYERLLRSIQEACPMDDDNEHGSWYYPPNKTVP